MASKNNRNKFDRMNRPAPAPVMEPADEAVTMAEVAPAAAEIVTNTIDEAEWQEAFGSEVVEEPVDSTLLDTEADLTPASGRTLGDLEDELNMTADSETVTVDDPTDEQLEAHNVGVLTVPANIPAHLTTGPIEPPVKAIFIPVAGGPKVSWLKHKLAEVDAHDYRLFRKAQHMTHVAFMTTSVAVDMPYGSDRNAIISHILSKYDTDEVAALPKGDRDRQLLQYLGQLTERGWSGLVNGIIVQLTKKA